MTTFTIDHANTITAFASEADIQTAEGSATFTSENALAALAEDWPLSRLVEVWNCLPENTPVRKFADRQKGVARIWKAIQNLPVQVPEPPAQKPDVAPEEVQATTKTTRAKKAPEAAHEAKRANQGSKTANILDLIQREGGATLNEIMAVTGWQKHSVRGFLSGTVTKKMGLTVTSSKDAKGERTYSVKA